MVDPEDLVTFPEIIERSKMPSNTLYRWSREGRLPPPIIDRRYNRLWLWSEVKVRLVKLVSERAAVYPAMAAMSEHVMSM